MHCVGVYMRRVQRTLDTIVYTLLSSCPHRSDDCPAMMNAVDQRARAVRHAQSQPTARRRTRDTSADVHDHHAESRQPAEGACRRVSDRHAFARGSSASSPTVKPGSEMPGSTRRRSVITAVLATLMALVGASSAHAQGAVITGRVTGATGEQIEEAQVYIQELGIAASTNQEGSYNLVVPG